VSKHLPPGCIDALGRSDDTADFSLSGPQHDGLLVS